MDILVCLPPLLMNSRLGDDESLMAAKKIVPPSNITTYCCLRDLQLIDF